MADIRRSKISGMEWGIVIGTLAFIDIVQLLLDLLAIGVVANTAIDLAVAFIFPFYLHMRGESMGDPKRLGGFLAAFGLEAIPLVNGLPLWTLDGIYNYILARSRTKIAGVQEAEVVKQEKIAKMEMQAERWQRIQQARQRQQEDRQQQQSDDEDLYDRAA